MNDVASFNEASKSMNFFSIKTCTTYIIEPFESSHVLRINGAIKKQLNEFSLNEGTYKLHYRCPLSHPCFKFQ
jgi:hypothetical protein